MGLILKAAGVGLIVSVIYMILAKSGREEQAVLVSLCGVVIILLMIVNELSELIASIRSVFGV
ncbi:MAG: stage III sporulation protein AC [Firmicutes bacterium]|nr:stage III sporulation protein AC [Bacillota bacterium]